MAERTHPWIEKWLESGAVFFGVVAMIAVVTLPQLLDVVWCSAVAVVVAVVEGSLEVKLPTIWTDEKQSREESERRERLEERRVEEKE